MNEVIDWPMFCIAPARTPNFRQALLGILP
jgi:hypothetical protein